MPATKAGICTVCRHPERERIEDMRAAGVPYEALAEKFGMSRMALHRHWHTHVSADRRLTFLVGKTTVQQMRERAVEENLSLLDYLGIVRSVLTGQLVAQAEAGASHAAAAVAGRLVEVLREIGKITGEIQRNDPSITINNTVAIVNAPGFADLQAGLLQIARAHPEARGDIVALLRGLDPTAAPRAPAPLLLNGAAHA